jgi:hypothetical protein
MAASRSSVGTLPEDEDLDDVVATPEEVREMFEADVRRVLGISGDEFLGRVKSGEIVNDDSDSRITYLFVLVPYLPNDSQSS